MMVLPCIFLIKLCRGLPSYKGRTDSTQHGMIDQTFGKDLEQHRDSMITYNGVSRFPFPVCR